jgi:hypothetical protein
MTAERAFEASYARDRVISSVIFSYPPLRRMAQKAVIELVHIIPGTP